jgi:hypothetical protein
MGKMSPTPGPAPEVSMADGPVSLLLTSTAASELLHVLFMTHHLMI